MRLVATVAAVALVAATALAARIAAGGIASGWAAWTAFAFGSSVLLDAHQLEGELVTAAFVAGSFAGLLAALRADGGRRGAVWSAVAGAAALAAVLSKQNFVDGLVFAGALLVATVVRARRFPGGVSPRPGVAASGFGAGGLTVAGAAAWWASRHGGVGTLLYAMYGFRQDASTVIAGWSWTAPLHRLGLLWAAAVVSGLVVLAAHLLWAHRRRLVNLSPVAVALTATGSVEVAGIAGGGNFWLHYLLALVPTVALAAGLAARPGQPGARRTRRLVVYAVLATLVVSSAYAVADARTPSAPYTTGRWLADASRPDDTLVVPYTHANVIGASELAPAYPYSWSLPLRTLDPRLRLLARTLDGGSTRPTWVVVWDDLQSWGLDPDHRVERALRRHYRPIAQVCGHQVWLRDGAVRALPSEPRSQAC
ncbi:MAG: hypothetical protein ACTHOK_19545 [Nocardioidaceae bacterium]